MKKRFFALLIAAIAAPSLSLAQAPQPPAAQRPAAAEVATIAVNGLVCDFCVQSIKKMAGQRPEIAATAVDLDAGRVTVTFRPGQTMTDAALRTLITNAGYAVVSIQRGRA
jgi:copper chaperone CopZ